MRRLCAGLSGCPYMFTRGPPLRGLTARACILLLQALRVYGEPDGGPGPLGKGSVLVRASTRGHPAFHLEGRQLHRPHGHLHGRRPVCPRVERRRRRNHIKSFGGLLRAPLLGRQAGRLIDYLPVRRHGHIKNQGAAAPWFFRRRRCMRARPPAVIVGPGYALRPARAALRTAASGILPS